MSIILLKRNHAPTLSSEFDSRRNNLTPLRLGLAVAVLVTHGQSNGFGWQVHLGRTELGQVALDSFFVISGLLVTRSYLALGSFARFAWHRFLRIMPGFWVCLLVTALVFAPIAALVERGSAGAAFSGDRSALHYVVNNAGLLMRQYDIAGLLSTVPNPEVFNGSLWTLVFEAVCYALLGLVGLCGILQRRRWVVGAGVVALWGLLFATELGLLPLPGTTLAPLLRFAFVFALGSAAWLYADRLPISPGLAVGALGTVVLALLTTDHSYLLLGGVGLAYLLVWVTVRAPLPWRPRADLSYGVYVYHWPVQQLLALVGLSALGPTPTVLLGLVGAATCALASWHLVERPALRQKDARWVSLLERGQVAESARP